MSHIRFKDPFQSGICQALENSIILTTSASDRKRKTEFPYESTLETEAHAQIYLQVQSEVEDVYISVVCGLHCCR